MAELPEDIKSALASKSRRGVNRYTKRIADTYGYNSREAQAMYGYAYSRFGDTPIVPEINEITGRYELELDDRYDAANRLASNNFIKDIETELNKTIQERIPNPNIQQQTTPGFFSASSTIENPEFTEARKNLVREKLKDDLARSFNENPQNIDITSGLDDKSRRFLLSFQEEPENKLAYLKRNFGEDNVKQFKFNNRDNFIIQDGSKRILVDELGASFGDVLDASRGILTAGFEIAGAFVLPQAKLLKAKPFLSSALGAGTGVGLAEGIGETVEASTGGEFEALQIPKEGAIATGIDYGFGKGLSYVGRALLNNQSIESADKFVDDILGATSRLEREFAEQGINIKPSQSMLMGEAAADVERTTIGRIVREGLPLEDQPEIVRARIELADNLKQVLDILTEGKIDPEAARRAVESNYRKLADRARTDMLEVGRDSAEALRKYYNNLADDVISEGARDIDIVDLATNLKSIATSADSTSKNISDDLYESVKLAAKDVPPRDMLKVAKELIDSIDSIDGVPLGDKDKVIFEFFPKSILEALSKSEGLKREAKIRLKRIAKFEENLKGFDGDQMTMFPMLFDETLADPGQPLTIGFEQLVEFKKSLGKKYGTPKRGAYLDRQALNAMVDSLDNTLENMAEESGSEAFDLLKEANKYWKDNRRPILDDRTLQKVLQQGPDEVYGAGSSIDYLIGKKDSVVTLNKLRRGLPEESIPEFNNAIRESILQNLFVQVKNTDNIIDTRQLNKLLENAELLSEKSGLFDAEAIKRLRRLTRVTRDQKNIISAEKRGPEVTESLIRGFLDSGNIPEDELDLLTRRFNDAVDLSARTDAMLSNKAIEFIRQGGGEFADNINATMKALSNLDTPGQVKDFFDLLDDGMKDQVRAKVRSQLFSEASRSDEGLKTSTQFGQQRLPSVNSPIMRELADDESALHSVYKEILGEDGLQTTLDVVTVLSRLGDSVIARSDDLIDASRSEIIARGGSGPSSILRQVIRLDFSSPYYKLLGMALASDSFVKAVNRGDADQAILNVIPFVFGADEPLALFMQESLSDPRLINTLPRQVSGIENRSGVNDSLVEDK